MSESRRFLGRRLPSLRQILWFGTVLLMPPVLALAGAALYARQPIDISTQESIQSMLAIAVWAAASAVCLALAVLYSLLRPMAELAMAIKSGKAVPVRLLTETGSVGRLARALRVLQVEIKTTAKKSHATDVQLAHEREVWHKATNMLPWAVLWVRKSGHIVRLNAEAEQLFGRTLSQLVGMDFPALFDLSGQALVAAKLSRLRNGLADSAEGSASMLRHGQTKPQTMLFDLMSLGGDDDLVLALVRRETNDVLIAPEEVNQHQETRSSEERLRLAFAATRAGLWELDVQTGKFWCSPEFGALLGLDASTLPTTLAGRDALIHPEDLEWVKASAQRYLTQEAQDYMPEYRMKRRDGVWIWVEDRGQALWGEDGTVIRFSGIVTDCTERKRFEKQLSYMATHDPLTDLPNRTLLNDRLLHAVSAANRSGLMVGVLLIDLDRFKLVNESLGYEIGDQMLRDIAARLQQMIRPSDTLARLSADEFVVLSEGLPNPQEAARTARRLLSAMSQPYLVDGNHLSVSASIGVSVSEPTMSPAQDVQQLLRHAETAMQKAKAAGGNSYRFFVPEMDKEVVKRVNLERTIQDAIDRQQFVLHYQPKVDMVSGRVLGAEALIRWPHMRLGNISPGDFLQIAEESNQILAIGEWTIRETLAQLGAWRDKGLELVPVAVNISGRQLMVGGVDELILRLLREFDIPPHLLEIEITESSVIAGIDKVIPMLQRLRDAGVGVALDDFGTGYSSLAYLRQMPISTLKIDRSFIRDVPAKANACSLVALIVDVGHQLGLDVVAEGVETEDQRQFLEDNKCDIAQGWLFHKAMSPSRFAKLLPHSPAK